MGSATAEGRIDMGEKVIINIRTFMDGHRPPDRVLPGNAVITGPADPQVREGRMAINGCREGQAAGVPAVRAPAAQADFR